MHKLPITILLSGAALALPGAVRAQSEADFETALRSVPARTAARAAPEPGRPGPRPLVAPGMLPAEYSAPLSGRDAFEAARRAADQGLLDPLAWTERQIGPVPLLPGARVLRCRPNELKSTFTFGIEGSAEYRRAIDDWLRQQATAAPAVEGRGRRAADPALYRVMAIHGDAAKLPATAAKLREAAAFLRAKGYVPFGTPGGIQMWRRADAPIGRPTIDIWLRASPMLELSACSARGVTVPSGPIFYVLPTYPMPDWTDGIQTAAAFD